MVGVAVQMLDSVAGSHAPSVGVWWPFSKVMQEGLTGLTKRKSCRACATWGRLELRLRKKQYSPTRLQALQTAVTLYMACAAAQASSRRGHTFGGASLAHAWRSHGARLLTGMHAWQALFLQAKADVFCCHTPRHMPCHRWSGDVDGWVLHSSTPAMLYPVRQVSHACEHPSTAVQYLTLTRCGCVRGAQFWCEAGEDELQSLIR